MWQDKFIEMSLRLQSNTDGGLFRYLSNVNEMLKIMLTSWLVNVYLILFPIFTIGAVFLLLQSLRGWRYLHFPRLRWSIPVFFVLCITSGVVVFIQLSEINSDIGKIQKSSDYYTQQIIYQISSSINSTKKSLIKTLEIKKYHLFPLFDNIITGFVKIANRSLNNESESPNFSIDLFGKSDVIVNILKRAKLYANSTHEVRNSLIKLPKVCNRDLLNSRMLCHLYPDNCRTFFAELDKMERFFHLRDSLNREFIITFDKILPSLMNASIDFNVNQFLMTPVQFYDDGVRRIDLILDKVISEELAKVVSNVLGKHQPKITKYLQLLQRYAKFLLYIIVMLNVVFLLCITASVVLNLVINSNIKLHCPVIWSAAHFFSYLFGSIMLIVFVAGTSVLLNSQTEVCRYLGDISKSANVADRFIDSFLDHQSKYFLAKNIPRKILQIPKLNIKNPRGILTTVIRQCPASMILLPSLELYRPINSTALIFSDFVLTDLIQPAIIKANDSLHEHYNLIINTAHQLLNAKGHILDLLQYFPKDGNKQHFSFGKLNQAINTLNFRRNKVFSDETNEIINFDDSFYDECFGFLSNSTIFMQNEDFLHDLMEDMKYFELLIRDLVVVLDNVKANIDLYGEKFFTDFLLASVEPSRSYANRLVGIIEEDVLSRVIPCDELSGLYLETVHGVCTNQLGNFLVLTIFGTLTFTIGNLLLLVIMMSY